jgi:hypothetical protein
MIEYCGTLSIGKELAMVENNDRGQVRKPVSGGKLPPQNKGKTRDKVAKATGISARTLGKAAAVVDAAEKDPENYGTCERQPPTSPRLGTRVGRPV